MTPEQEHKFDIYEKKYFRSQRELPANRDFRWNMEKNNVAEANFRSNFDTIFPSAPGCGF